MSVYKPKNSPHWHFDFQFKGQRYYGSTNCTSRREAEAYERRQRHQAANPATTRPTITLDEACGLYQDHAETQPSWPTTRYMLRAMVAGLGGKRLLSEIGQRELQIYIAKRRNGRSNATINREIDTMRAVWARAESSRYDVGHKPSWKTLYLRVSKQPPREMAEDEKLAVFDAISVDAYDVVVFALLSGWRKAEIIGLRWSDVNFPRSEAKTRIKGGDTIVRPLTTAMVTLLASQPQVGPFVFTYVCRKSRAKRREGQRYPMTVTALRTRWDEARKAAQLKGFRFHDLRHTAATHILRETQNLALAKRALAHTRIETTLRYAHVLDDDVRQGLSVAQSRIIPEQALENKRKA